MSAIWGIITGKNQPALLEQAKEQMTSIYEKRCKLDKIEEKEVNNCYFSCGLQFITKEAEHEKLPIMNTNDGIYLTADTMLDNREDLCNWLSVASNTPDGSLVYAAYRKEGIACLKHLQGMFALAIYDARQDCTYIAVDPLAQRCLYYRIDQKHIYFSTLIAPIASVGQVCTYNTYYQKDFLLAPGMMPNLVPGETPYQEIMQVKPGSYLCIKDGKITEHFYWKIEEQSIDHKKCKVKACQEEFIQVFRACTASALRTKANISICLSSGLDSASVAAFAVQQLEKQGKSLFSYTYVPALTPPKKQERSYFIPDETQLVEELVSKYPSITPHFLNNQGKNCLTDLEKIREIMEIPFKACVNLPNLLEIYQQAYANGSRIVLSGQYGNSTISYGHIEPILYELHKKKKWFTYLQYLNGYCTKTVKQSRLQAWKAMRAYFVYADKNAKQKKEIRPQIINPFLTEAILEQYPYKERFSHISTLLFQEDIPDTSESRLKKMEILSSYMYIGAYETKLGLAAGVVVRDPTRDIRMIQFCNSIPFPYFAYKGCVRWLIRGIMKDALPASYQKWPRYGIQNADWHLRILRDWKQVRSKFEDLLQKQEIQTYLDIEKYQALLSKINQSYASGNYEEITWEKDLQYLCFLLTL